jgi:isocitrate lyase
MFNGRNGVNGHGDKALNSPFASALGKEWQENPRWQGVLRPYTPGDVLRLRGSLQIEYTLARLGAQRLWDLLQTDAYVAALGALTGNQAVQQVKAGLKAI